MATDYGVDVDCVTDIDKGFALVTGFKAVAQALARRLQTPRGGLFYDLDYGTDVRDLVEEGLTAREIAEWQAAIAQECEKDERVEHADATIALDAAASTATIKVRVETSAGPFQFVLAVSALTVALLTNP